jgi:hypothetical protein
MYIDRYMMMGINWTESHLTHPAETTVSRSYVIPDTS